MVLNVSTPNTSPYNQKIIYLYVRIRKLKRLVLYVCIGKFPLSCLGPVLQDLIGIDSNTILVSYSGSLEV